MNPNRCRGHMVRDRFSTRAATIVGAGPNGLAAAMLLARAGWSVTVIDDHDRPGGGARTAPLGMTEGIVHDLCSAVHPLALASPFFRSLDLGGLGVEFVIPEISYAQAMDLGQGIGGAPGALAYRDLDRTVANLGSDGPAWRWLFEPLVRHHDALIAALLGDRAQLPDLLWNRDVRQGLAAFAHRVSEQGSPLWNSRFTTRAAPALFAGVASHATGRHPHPVTAAVGLVLGMLGHVRGWPIPRGGSQSITTALVNEVTRLGGRFDLGRIVTHIDELPMNQVIILNTSPTAASAICALRIPAGIRQGLRRHRLGAAAAKVDFVVEDSVPWLHPDLGRAATVHLGGTRHQLTAAEHAVMKGQVPNEPVVLVSEPANHDPSRRSGRLRPVWAYMHVPTASELDPLAEVTARIERYAPGFRDTIVAAHTSPASRMHRHSLNYLGGDIAVGPNTIPGMLARPRPALDPYRLGTAGIYLASAGTPPGPGVHGLAGAYAAARVLADAGEAPPSDA